MYLLNKITFENLDNRNKQSWVEAPTQSHKGIETYVEEHKAKTARSRRTYYQNVNSA